MADLSLPQPILDALTKAQGSKATADASAADQLAKAVALTAAQHDSDAAVTKAATDAAQLDSDRRALDAVIDSYFQPVAQVAPAAAGPAAAVLAARPRA